MKDRKTVYDFAKEEILAHVKTKRELAKAQRRIHELEGALLEIQAGVTHIADFYDPREDIRNILRGVKLNESESEENDEL